MAELRRKVLINLNCAFCFMTQFFILNYMLALNIVPLNKTHQKLKHCFEQYHCKIYFILDIEIISYTLSL